MKAHVVFGLLAALALAACKPAAEQPVQIMNAYSVSTAPGATVGAAYMIIESRDGDVLESAATPVAASVEMHVTERRDGMMTMRPLPEVSISAGGRFEFAPGGPHFMLLDLSAPLEPDTSFPITLRFRTAGEVTTDVRVLAPGKAPTH